MLSPRARAAVAHRGGLSTRVESIWPSPDLFQRLGGRDVLEKVVDGLYDRIDADPILKPIFLGRAQGEHRHQKYFFEEWMGGEPRYRRHVGGLGTEQLHRRFSIDRRAAGRWLRHMTCSLREQEVAEPLVREIMSLLGPMAHRLGHRESGDVSERDLRQALLKNDMERVAQALAQGLDPRRPIPYDGLLVSPRAVAESADAQDVCALLQDHGASLDVFDLAYLGRLPALEALLDEIPELLDVDDPAADHRGLTLLHHAVHGAVRHGGWSVTCFLLRRGCRLPADLVDLWTRAADAGSLEAVEAFLDRGARAEQLEVGLWARRPAVSRRLIAAGAQVDRPPGAWLRFCGRGSTSGDDPELIQAMLELGVRREARLDGKGALHLAVGAGFLHIACLLLEKGFAVDEADHRGDTPLAHVAWSDPTADRDAMTRLLVDYGADPRIRNDAGISSLDRAGSLRRNVERRRMLERAAVAAEASTSEP